MHISELVVPYWYLEARRAGSSAEQLRDKVREFCLEALRMRAQKNAQEPPQSVDESLLDITIKTYEDALGGAL